MHYKKICLWLLLTAISGSVLAAETPLASTTHEYKLDNGLKLIVREDHRSPLVVTQVWYKVGSSYEPNGITGISHALEHMMFRGTTNHPKDEFSRLIAIGGGDQNAFTAHDFTAYFQELDAERLKLCFELEADRMANLTLPEEAFKQEIKVVMEERRLRTDDNPESLTRERLHAAAHVSNPYHHWPIGWMDDLENLTVEDLRAWYKTWYGPNNAIVVVVGDVNPEAVYQLAKTYFGPLKSITIPTLKPRKELVNLGKRQIQVNANATVPRLFMGYNVPSIITTSNPEEPYALIVLLMALDGGNSGRFSKDLIRDQGLVAGVSSSYDPFSLYETLMEFSAIPTQNHTLAEVETALLQQFERLKTAPISDAELNRIKVNAIAQHAYAKDSMTDQAIGLGSLESVGLSWKLADTFPEKIQTITAEAVQKVAQKYLTQERLTTAELIPLKSGT
ncbi:MAG TPA: pitrilysin family protein [Gammaproteobacteria bacterium]|nr:pitrilysin family protein [Gammaproteobacteria bacterium]